MMVLERIAHYVYVDGHEFTQRLYLQNLRCLLKIRSAGYAKGLTVMQRSPLSLRLGM